MHIETRPYSIYHNVIADLALLTTQRLLPVELVMTQREHGAFIKEALNDGSIMSYTLQQLSNNNLFYNGIPIRIVPELDIEKTKRDMKKSVK